MKSLTSLSSSQPGYRADIDGLRAIAVLAVVAFHAGLPGFSGGFVGVDVFFVISGYLISGLLLNEVERTGRVDLLAFYARRVRRILPTLLVVVAATLLLALLVFPDDQKRVARSVTSVFFFFSNHYILGKAGGYFEPTTDLVPFLHTWSLAVEEQFYFVWPLLFLLLAHFFKGTVRQAGLIAVVALLTLLSLLGSIWLTSVDMPQAFYLMPSRAWEFGIGMLTLCYVRYGKPVPESLARVLGLLGLAGLARAVATYHELMTFPGTAALLPVISTALLLLSGTRPGTWVTRLLSSPPATAIGLLSYSWYLWHWPLMSLARIYDLGQRSLERDSLLGLLALGLAWLTFGLVENRFRQARGWLATKRSTVLTGFAASVLIVLVGQLVVLWSGYLDRHMGGAYHAKNDIPPLREFCHFEAKTYVDQPQLQNLPRCSLGGIRPEVVLWGDSHAGHLMPLLMRANQETSLRVMQRSQAACPPLLGAIPYENGRFNTACVDFNKKMHALIRGQAAQGAKGIVLAGRWLSYLYDPLQSTPAGKGVVPRILVDEGGHLETDSQKVLQVFERALNRTVGELVAQNLRVLLVAPVPQMPFRAPECLVRRSVSACSAPADRFREQRYPVMEVFGRLVARYPDRVRVADPAATICQGKLCSPMKNGIVLYSDDNHLTASAAERLYPYLGAHLQWLAGHS